MLYNIYIDYRAPVAAPIVRAKLVGIENARHVICIGDSIAAGAHTPARLFHNNDSESWCGLLRQQFGTRITFVNQAAPEVSIGNANYQLMDSKIDTAIIAFGMNDHVVGLSALPLFKAHLDALVKKVRNEGAAAIILGFFQENPLWIRERSTDTLAYNDAIRQVARQNHVPFVDVRRAFDRVAGSQQSWYELTADFLHHPNIYGQRVYFSLLAPYFLKHDEPVAELPKYVIGAEQ